MKKYKITLISDNLPTVLMLMNIIDSYCMNVVDVTYFLSLDKAIHFLKKEESDIVILEKKSFDIINIKNCIKLDTAIILMSSNDASKIPLSDKKVFTIDTPINIENVIATINTVLRERLKLMTFNPLDQQSKQYVTIVSQDKTDFIEMKNILYCRAEGKYTSFYVNGGKKIVSSKNLGEYEKQLSQRAFFRIHHSYIININHMIRIIKCNTITCEMTNKDFVPIAKRKFSLFNKYVKEMSQNNILEFL